MMTILDPAIISRLLQQEEISGTWIVFDLQPISGLDSLVRELRRGWESEF